ncbi:tetratricopeptide repeat protein, partial [bacterium]|nr:tetratricopeptide repeat protein [bacterium]
MRLLAAVFLCAFTAAGPAAAIEPDYTETDILKVLDRRPLEVEFFDAAAQGSDIYLATSGGLLQVNLSERRAKKIIREPVTAAAWDGERIVAAGAGGVWREDLGWVRPVGFDPSVLRVSSMQLAGGVLLVSRTDLWKLSGSRSVHLYYDSAGLAGAPAASTDEIAVLGFWALHKIGFSGADAAEINVQDIPLPPALRADVPLGVAYVDRTILAIGRRTGVHLLPPGASEFSGLIPPPPLAEAHLQAGFPEGWVDFAVVEGRIYLMLADAALYTLDPARSPAVLHRVSRWPDPAQPFQFEVLPAAAARGDLSRHILLFPFSGNFVLDADLTDNLPKKWNFVTTPLGEILVREGLPPKQFGAAGLVFSLWGSLVVVLLLLLIVFAARIFRRRFSGTTAAMALCAGLLLQACGAPRDIPPPSVSVPVAPVAETDTETQLRDTLSQAIEAAESILKISPADADALLAAALAAEHLGRLDIAVRYYARLQEVTRETAHLQKLAELTRLSDPAAAYQYAIRFFEGGGSDDRLRFWLIQQHANRQNVSQAYALTEFLTPPPDQFAAGFLRDLCLQYALSLPSAAPDALTALRRATRFAPLPSHLAETAALGFLNAGDARAAEEMLKPFPGPAHVLRARIAESLGNAPDALSQRLKYFRAGGRDPRELLVLLDALGRADPARGVAEALWSANRDLDPRMRIQIARRLARFYRESPSPDTAAEIGFLEELRPLNDPLFLDRLAELQRAVGNAREALSILQTRYPDGVPKDKIDFYVSQALSAGEIQEALRAAEAAPQAVSAPIRLRLADILNRSAEESMSAGEWDKASAAAQRAARLAVDPRNHKTFARISLRQSDTPAALRYLSAALKDAPGDPVANFMKGMILVSQGKWSEAKAPLEIAHAARHPDDRVTLLLGRALFSLGLFDRAFSALQEYAVIRNQQVDPPVQELTGRAALSAGRPAEAAAWFERRLVSGADEKISAALLDALIASGQKAKALGAAREMVVRHPAARPILESAVGVFDLATDSPMLLRTLESLSSLTSEPDRKIAILRRLLDVKLQMGRAAEADAILTTLLSKFPNDPQLLTEAWKLRKGTSAVEPILKRLAVIRSPGDPIQLIHARRLMEDGRLDDSLRVVRAYGTVQKTDAAALALESEIWIGKKRPDEAARVYRALLAIRRDETARRWLVNHIHDQVLSAVASGKPLPGAGPLYRETLDLLGSEEKIQDLFELFGKLFDRAGDRTLAIDALRREFRNTTDVSKRMRLAERLGDWYYRDAQLSLAREMYVSAREAGNRSPDFLRNFSGLLERLGESDEAASLHAEILKNFPYDRDANLFLARRATAQGRREEALKFLESLRAASPADSAVLTAIGGAYAGLGRHDQAAGVWRSLRDLTGDPKFLSKYADALYESGQHQKALLEYRELFTYGVADPEQLRRLAALEQNQGSWDQAVRILLTLLRT